MANWDIPLVKQQQKPDGAATTKLHVISKGRCKDYEKHIVGVGTSWKQNTEINTASTNNMLESGAIQDAILVNT